MNKHTQAKETHIRRRFQHVVAVPTWNWDEGHRGRAITDLFDVGAHFFNDLIIAFLTVGRLRGIHLVDSYNQLLDAQRVGQQGVFPCLPIFRDARLKFTHSSCHN